MGPRTKFPFSGVRLPDPLSGEGGLPPRDGQVHGGLPQSTRRLLLVGGVLACVVGLALLATLAR